MEALVYAVIVLNLHLLACVWFPGIALRIMFPIGAARAGPRINLLRPGNWAIQSLALGSLWSGAQLLILMGVIRPAWHLSPGGMLAVLYTSNLMLIAAVGYGLRRELRRRLAPLLQLWRELRRPETITGIVISFVIAGFAIFQFPYAGDNSALYWVAHAASNPQESFASSEGALGYLGWMYWPSLLVWPTLAPATIGAAAKLSLNLLAFLTARSICALHPATDRRGIPLLLYLGMATAFIGDYGLLVTGKETVFSVLFLFMAMATLLEGRPTDQDDDRDWTVSALLALAIGCGSIAVPYGAIFVLLALHTAGPFPKPSQLAFKITAAVSLPCAFAFSTMLKLPIPVCLAGLGLVPFVILLLHRPFNAWFRIWYRFYGGRRRRLNDATLLLGTMGLVALLFPVHYDAIPIQPLDGTMRFANIFLSSDNNGVMPPYVGWLAVAGMLAALVPSKASPAGSALVTLFIFPFITLIPCLLVVHHGKVKLPFEPQKLWDLVKDIPNWCWGVLAHYAALFLLIRLSDSIGLRIPLAWARLRNRCRECSVGLIFGLALIHFGIIAWGGRLGALTRWNLAPHFTSAGGNRTPEMALMSGKLVQHLGSMSEQGRRPPLLVQKTSIFGEKYWDLNSSGVHVEIRDFFDDRGATDSLQDEKEDTFFLIAKRESLLAWWGQGKGQNRRWQELIGFPGGDSLLIVKPLAKDETPPAVLLTALPPFIIRQQTFPAALGLAPPVNWDNFAAAPLRTKDGDSYLWGGRSGTIWVAINDSSRHNPDIEIKLRFKKGVMGSLTMTSPLLGNLVVLSAQNRQFQGPLKQEGLNSPVEYYGHRWVPFHFQYEGELRYEKGWDYPRTYSIDSLSIFGKSLID